MLQKKKNPHTEQILFFKDVFIFLMNTIQFSLEFFTSPQVLYFYTGTR